MTSVTAKALTKDYFEPSFLLPDVLKAVKLRPVARRGLLEPFKIEQAPEEQNEAVLQKGEVMEQLGNHEMALVYYHRGAKRYPNTSEFKDAIARADKRSTKKGRRMKLTTTGDITYFTASHKLPPPKQFRWKTKPVENVKKSLVPSANFRSRLVHPLINVHRKPEVQLTESRATKHSFLSGSLESLAYEDRLIEETTEKNILGKMINDKEYLEFLLEHEVSKNKKTPLGQGYVADAAEAGIHFLLERTQFWDSLGPLPPPHPSRKTNSQLRNKSSLSQCTSSESLQSLGTYNSNSTSRSFTSSKYIKGNKSYRSRYAYGRRKEKPVPPKPEKVKFEFASYRRDEDLREMTLIPEEMEPKDDMEEEHKKLREEAIKRGEETTTFIEKEIEKIDQYYSKGQLDLCRKRADACIDVLGRFTEDEIPAKTILLSTLYSCLGRCDMHSKNYTSALENHSHDLMIGEQSNNPDIQSRALGNLGRVHVLMGKYNRALDIYNRKAPLCKTAKETAWLFHEIGNCFLMMKIYEYAHESGLKAIKSATEADDIRLQLQSLVLAAVAEVNLMKYKDAYQHFEEALERAKVLDDKRAQDAMTRALVDVNKKMVKQLKSKKSVKDINASPAHYDIPITTPVSRATPHSALSNVTVEG